MSNACAVGEIANIVRYENALVNLTGRPGHFMSIDEACEITVDAIKHDFNPRGSWQSKDYHMQTVSPNINIMREIRRQLMNTSGGYYEYLQCILCV